MFARRLALHMKTKAQYKVKNWNAYDAFLKQRGSIAFWVNEEVIEQWCNQQKTGERVLPTITVTWRCLRQPEAGTLRWERFNRCFICLDDKQKGFWSPLLMLMRIELAVPDHSTLSRRLSKLSVKLPVVPKDQAVHVVMDSTWVKVYGKGEWKVRTYGVGKRRTWRKLHLGVDSESGEIPGGVVTTNDMADCEVS